MNWRVGTKVPLNVYEGDRPVCQCHNPEDAARIVAAMSARATDDFQRLKDELDYYREAYSRTLDSERRLLNRLQERGPR